MQKYLCMIGIHRYHTVDLTDFFTTTYLGISRIPIKHIVWYQACKCCGKRRVKDTYKKDTFGDTHHPGIEHAKVAWVEHSIAYVGNGQKKTYPDQTPPKKSKLKLKIIEGSKK